MSELFQALGGNFPQNDIVSQARALKQQLGNANPQAMVQALLNSGQMSQAQFNQLAQQAQQIIGNNHF